MIECRASVCLLPCSRSTASMLISRKSVKDGEFAWFRNLSQADQQCKKLCGLRQNTQGVLNALRKAWAHGYLLAFYWRFWQLPPQATLVKRARYAKLAKPLSFKVLRQVVENTVGDVVQLVRTLPRHWLESHTVTGPPSSTSPSFSQFL